MAIKGSKIEKSVIETVDFPCLTLGDRNSITFNSLAMQLFDGNQYIMYDDRGFFIPCMLEKNEEGNYILETYMLSYGVVEIGKSAKRKLTKSGRVVYKEMHEYLSQFESKGVEGSEENKENKESEYNSSKTPVFEISVVNDSKVGIDDLLIIANNRKVFQIVNKIFV